MCFKIRKEETGDIDVVYKIIEDSFKNQEFSNKEEVNLVKNLRKTDDFIPELSLVGELNGDVVAYILFSTLNFELKNGDIEKILTLAPVCVSPLMQNNGFGSKLIEKGHELAKNLGFKGIMVVGHQDYYPKFNYSSISNFDICLNMEIPSEVVMLYEIEKDYFKNNSGKIIFSNVFMP